MTPDQAADLAARTLAAIDARMGEPGRDNRAADRERIASDLDGLRDCYRNSHTAGPLTDRHARRYAAGLRRTAALYGVTG